MTTSEFIARCKKPKRAGKGHVALCPAHDDDRHSLSVGEGNDGKILLSCKAGCSTEDVVKAMGLTMFDLFPAGTGKPSPFATRPRKVVKKTEPASKPLSEADVAEMVKALRNDSWAWRYVTETLGIPEDVTEQEQLGLHLPASGRGMWLAYPYRQGGKYTYAKLRSMGGEKEFQRWPKGQGSHLYNVDDLVAGGFAVVFEGERDAVAAIALDGVQIVRDMHSGEGKKSIAPVALVSIPDGVNSATKPVVIQPLKTQQRIYLALDDDGPGNKTAEAMADDFGREKCWRVRFPGFKDLGDLLAAKGARVRTAGCPVRAE